MKIIKIFIITTIIFCSQLIYCQNEISFGFKFDDSVKVYDTLNLEFQFAWSGGLNSVQFCELDLNLDGISDLVLFDRTGDKLLFFVANFENSSVKYIYSPQYFNSFPKITNWIICKDYDNDGKNDIFTYTRFGIKVYRNESNNNELKFKQVTSPFIESYYNQIYSNIPATSADYPAIEDIDGDGDLDILVFGPLGSYVEFHKNYSMERYGTSDSLLYYKESDCWGRFAESEESNVITLNTCPGKSELEADNTKNEKHTGSTFLLFDADGDGLLDLLLGDVDYTSPCLLFNKGTVDEALITDYTFSFPDNNPINLFSFPVMNYLDIDKDGKKELIVSTFDPAQTKIANTNSVWLYKNIAEENSPQFVLETKSFFQDKMIDVGSGAYPLLFDYDNDGDLDLFVGNYGYWKECSYDQYMNLTCKYTSQIAYFENVGNSSNPEFVMITDDFASLSNYDLLGLYPAFFDYNNDGDFDLFCGNSDGTIILFENLGNDDFFMRNADWLNLSSMNLAYSTPCFYDFNKDGKSDLVIGNERGRIVYYENDGNNEFIHITDSLGEIDVRDQSASWSGYSTPCAFNHNDTTYLFVGSESGNVFCYYDIDNNLEGVFKEKILSPENLGYRTAPAVGNLNNVSYPEMIIGNFSGGLHFYEGVKSTLEGIENIKPINIKIYPNPGNNVIYIDSENDYLLNIFDLSGKIVFTKNISVGINQVDVKQLPKNSLYILKFSGKDGSNSFKWMKE
ncbi:MAG: T9SS type A sorting domain-containing protein [Bacteroidales bacterium]|jgi:hypothetical protein|nr:T9SS type A sorting domain-containing protein [Bacteroidales bacterium]